MKFACVDGPEFNAHQVDFDELMMRNRSYAEFEKLSDERHQCKLIARAKELEL
jgi:ferredoxin--NADP+ reductase